MNRIVITVAVPCFAAACTTMPNYDVADLPDKDTGDLCRIVAANPDESYRREAEQLLIRRGATAEKCMRLIETDRAMFAASVAVSGAALAAAAGGGYHPGYGSYGVAWDQFYDGQWRCRDKANGQFVPDYRCSHLAMVDTWPSW